MGSRKWILGISALFVALAIPTHSYAVPNISGVVVGSEAKVNSVVRLTGEELLSVKQVFVDGLRTSFFASSNNQIAIRIPIDSQPGDAEILLMFSDGSIAAKHRIEIVATQTPQDTKVTIGTFLGYVAVYTKNLAGHKLSIQLGNKLREVSYLEKNYTANLTRVGSNRLVEVKISVDNQLMKTQLVLVQ